MKISYSITEGGLTFQDTLILSDNHKLSAADIESIKRQRFEAWYALVTTPVDNPDPEDPPQE